MNLTASSLVDQQVPETPTSLLPRPADDAGDVRAVAVVVLARSLALDHVEAVGVVDVAVLVVVLAVVRLVLALVDVARRGRGGRCRSRCRGSPPWRSSSACPRRPARRCRGRSGESISAYWRRVEGVVGRLVRGELEEVGLGVGDLGAAGEPLAQGAGRAARARPHDDQPAAADRLEALRDAAVEARRAAAAGGRSRRPS